MPKFVFVPKRVQNLGGYIVESKANLPYRDVVVGNPHDFEVKIDVPIYSEAMIEAIKENGLIVEPIYAGDSLKEALNKVRAKVGVEKYG